MMFGNLIPDRLSLLVLDLAVSSWVGCFETTGSPLHSEKQILEVLYSNTWVMCPLTLGLFLCFMAPIKCKEGVALRQAGTPISSCGAGSLSILNWFT